MSEESNRIGEPTEHLIADRQGTAYHEAGHAVVSLVLGLIVERVSIIAGDDSEGRCTGPSVLACHSSGRKAQRVTARANIVACFAGMPAQRLVDPQAPDYHGEQDDEDAFELSRQFEVLPRGCSHVGDDRHWEFLNKLRTEAARCVRRNKQAIAALAQALLIQSELAGDAVERIVRPLLLS